MEFNLFPICGWTTKDGKPAVIGFAGKAHAGKDIAGKYLVDKYYFKHYYFAKPLKAVSYTHLTLPTNREV